MSNLQGWGTYDDEVAKEEVRQAKEENTRDSFASPDKEGAHHYRILPPFPGEKGLFIRAYRHFIEWPGMKEQIRTNCPRIPTRGQQPCPFCKKGFELYNSEEEGIKKIGKDMLPRMTVFCRAIDRAEPSKGVQVLRLSKTVFDALQEIRNDPEDPTNFADVNNGYDVRVTREGTGRFDTEYKVKLAKKSTPLTEDPEEAAKWLEQAQAIDLKRLGALPSVDELNQLMATAMGGSTSSGELPSGASGQLPADTGKSRGERAPKQRDALGDFNPDADDLGYDEDDGIPS
jgi:hypothetical protein